MLGIVLLAGCSVIAPSTSTRVVLDWTTASEVNTAGFNLYRSENKDGPFTKVNDQLIPASVDPVAGGKYKYEDSNVVAGQTYYYQLEDVEYSGVTTRHGPIVATASSDSAEWLVLTLVAIGILGLVTVFFIRWQRKTGRANVDRKSQTS